MFTGRAKRGASLAELLICAGLCLLLLQIVHNLLLSARTYLDNAQSKSELQSELLKAVAAIGRELVESNRYAISAELEDEALVFASPRSPSGRAQYDELGRMLWTREVCIFVAEHNGEPVLVRKVQLVDPPVPDPPAPMPSLAIRGNPDLRSKRLARHITSFRPRLAADGTVEYTLRGERKISLRRYVVEIDEKVLPRN